MHFMNMLFVTVIVTITTLLSLVFADDTTTALLTINNPANNQKLTPNQLVIIQYTINGIAQANSQRQITNYPNTLKMNLSWKSKNDTNKAPIELTALSGLITEPSAGGLKNVLYTHKWKLPNCHFFRRYLPSEWSFSLIFEPEYSDLPPPAQPINSNFTNKHVSTVVPLGPQQSAISVPIDVSFNTTLLEDAHHKGC